MSHAKYPSLYQVNTRVWLTELSRNLSKRATLDDIPDEALDQLAEMGFDWVWFLSVWTTGELGRKVSRENLVFRQDFEETLQDLSEQDIDGSGFAIADYKVHPDLGGEQALQRLRARLKKRGVKLMLDFVPNHMGPDHPWVQDHPEYFVSGTSEDLETDPGNYTKLKSKDREVILAYGRDPYFSGWPDTVQVDFSNAVAAEAMMKELLTIAGQCDGVRCDMAMLILPEVFENTWGRRAAPFWPVAIPAVRKEYPEFLFMAEVYWEMEWELQQQGFDYTYDKRLYDRLHEGNTTGVRQHFFAGLGFQDRLVRFLENHDEARAASAFEKKKHEAAALITFLSPGLRFFHQGQVTGKRKKISPHLVRGPEESKDIEIEKFYGKLLGILKEAVFRNGQWSLLNCMPAWAGNDSSYSFLVFAWEQDEQRILVAVNYAPHQGQCLVQLNFADIRNKTIQLRDMMSEAVYERSGTELLSTGLFLDMPAWGYHVFDVRIV